MPNKYFKLSFRHLSCDILNVNNYQLNRVNSLSNDIVLQPFSIHELGEKTMVLHEYQYSVAIQYHNMIYMLICYLLCLCISFHSIVSDSYAVPMFHPPLVQLPINISKEWSLLHFYTYHYMQKKNLSHKTPI